MVLFWFLNSYLKTVLSFSPNLCLCFAVHTMSCEKSVNCCPVGCFAVTPVDDCKKVPCGVSVCKNPCNHVPSCCDYGFNSNCKKVACCVKPCTKSYHCIPSGCDYGCKDDCKKVACCMPVCSNPCNPVPSCWDYGCKDTCKKEACNNPCSNPCNHAAIMIVILKMTAKM